MRAIPSEELELLFEEAKATGPNHQGREVQVIRHHRSTITDALRKRLRCVNRDYPGDNNVGQAESILQKLKMDVNITDQLTHMLIDVAFLRWNDEAPPNLTSGGPLRSFFIAGMVLLLSNFKKDC